MTKSAARHIQSVPSMGSSVSGLCLASAVGLWAATPRLAAVESDLVLIGMPEACARDCNAGLFDAALYVGHGCMGWHALTIRAADENLLDLSIATKGGLACRSVVVSMVPAAAAGVEFA